MYVSRESRDLNESSLSGVLEGESSDSNHCSYGSSSVAVSNWNRRVSETIVGMR